MSGSFLAGDKVNMSITHDFVGVVIDARLDGSKMNLCLVTLSDIKIRKLSTPFPQPGIPFDLNNLTRPGMARIDTLEAITRPQWSQANVNLARKHLVRHERENIGPVPGNPAMPVAGMFWYKNRLYAIRDFPMVWFTSMNSYTFRVGHQVTMPGGVFEVLELHYISDNYTDGYMVVWPIDQNGNIMTILPEPGDIITRPSSYTAFDTGGAAFGELPIGTQGIVSFGDGKAVVTGEKGMIVRKK